MHSDESLSDKLLSIRREHVATKKQLAIELSVVLALFYVAPLYSGFTILLDSYIYHSTPVKDAAQILSYFGRIALILYLIWSRNEPFAKFGLSRIKESDLLWSIGICLLFGVTLFLVPSLELILTHLPGATKGYNILSEPSVWLAPVYFLVSAFFAELVWRSYVFRRLQELGVKAESAIFICAALFATLQIEKGWTAIPGYFLVGVALGFFFSKYQRLWPLVIGHAVYNLIFYLLHVPHLTFTWGLSGG